VATWDVKLPKASAPKFPPICVGCGAAPTNHHRIKRDAVGWWSLVRFGSLYGAATGRTIDVPTCAACAQKLKRESRKKTVLEWVFILTGVAISIWLLGDIGGIKGRLAMLGILVVVCLPYVIWRELFPAAVDITVTEGLMTFHFADEAYAQQFANENGITSRKGSRTRRGLSSARRRCELRVACEQQIS
jgi:hypothetical protein